MHFAALNGDFAVVATVKAKAPGFVSAFFPFSSSSKSNSLILPTPMCSLVNSKDAEGCFPLHWAAKHGKLDVLDQLIPDASVDVKDDKAQWTPLHYASNSNKLQVCEWLLQHGADKSQKDAHGRTALDISSERSYLSVMSLLQ